MAARRRIWKAAQPFIGPERLVFIDETGLNTKMTRLHGRAPRGQRLLVSVPFGHWKTTTFVAGLRLTGLSDTSNNQLDGGVGDESGAVMARGGSGLGFEWAFGRGGLPHKGPLQAAGWCSASQI